jgi:hypothetical protein
MESEWPQLAQKLPAGRWMRHWGLSSRRGGKPGDRGRQCAVLRRMQHDYLSARPADLSATAGICHDATGACVARHDQENFCAPTRRGDTSPAGRGLPQRTPLPRPPVRVFPGPQCVTTELTQAEKCGLLMVKLQSPLPNFI